MLKVIDCSQFQGTIDWAAVAADPQGIAGAVIRIGGGLSVYDTKAGANWAGAKAAGLIVMPYWYFVETVTGSLQADAYVARFKAVTGEDMGFSWWDYEVDNAVANSTSRERFQDALYRTWFKTGKLPGVYTSESKWESLIALYGDAPAWTPLTHLWVANYMTDYPAIPDGWLTWKLHQYTSTGKVNGIVGNVDINNFNGTLADLAKLAYGVDIAGPK